MSDREKIIHQLAALNRRRTELSATTEAAEKRYRDLLRQEALDGQANSRQTSAAREKARDLADHIQGVMDAIETLEADLRTAIDAEHAATRSRLEERHTALQEARARAYPEIAAAVATLARVAGARLENYHSAPQAHFSAWVDGLRLRELLLENLAADPPGPETVPTLERELEALQHTVLSFDPVKLTRQALAQAEALAAQEAHR